MSDESRKQLPGGENHRPLSDKPVVEIDLPNGEKLRVDGTGRILCNAHRGDGQLCKAPAIGGLKKCRMHAGMSKTSRQAARLKLAEAAQPAIAKLISLMGRAQSEAVQQRAADSLLDRAGYGRHSTIDVEEAKGLLLNKMLALREEMIEETETLQDEKEDK